MRRRLFAVASAISLLLCAAACIIWLRSYHTSDRLLWQRADGFRLLWSAEGHLLFSLYRGDQSAVPSGSYGLKYSRDIALPPINVLAFLCSSVGDTYTDWEWGHFWHHHRWNPQVGIRYSLSALPLWSIAAATSLLPFAWTTASLFARFRRCPKPGFCAACGYDLRATPHRCPECGAPAPV